MTFPSLSSVLRRGEVTPIVTLVVVLLHICPSSCILSGKSVGGGEGGKNATDTSPSETKVGLDPLNTLLNFTEIYAKKDLSIASSNKKGKRQSGRNSRTYQNSNSKPKIKTYSSPNGYLQVYESKPQSYSTSYHHKSDKPTRAYSSTRRDKHGQEHDDHDQDSKNGRKDYVNAKQEEYDYNHNDDIRAEVEQRLANSNSKKSQRRNDHRQSGEDDHVDDHIDDNDKHYYDDGDKGYERKKKYNKRKDNYKGSGELGDNDKEFDKHFEDNYGNDYDNGGSGGYSSRNRGSGGGSRGRSNSYRDRDRDRDDRDYGQSDDSSQEQDDRNESEDYTSGRFEEIDDFGYSRRSGSGSRRHSNNHSGLGGGGGGRRGSGRNYDYADGRPSRSSRGRDRYGSSSGRRYEDEDDYSASPSGGGRRSESRDSPRKSRRKEYDFEFNEKDPFGEEDPDSQGENISAGGHNQKHFISASV